MRKFDQSRSSFISSLSPLSVWVKYHQHHGIEKRQINNKGSNKRNSFFCESRTSICKCFYPDHPDAEKLRMKDYYSQTNITKNGIGKEEINIDSNNTLSTICEDTWSYCTYYHPDYPYAGQHCRRINGNYSRTTTVIVKETNNLWSL